MANDGPNGRIPNGSNGETDIERNGESHEGKVGIRTRLAAIIEDFSPIWFTLSMNTGIISILLHQLPYQFNGIGIISTVVFVFNLILFTIFGIAFLLRMTIYRRSWIKACATNLNELALLGAIPIAWFTLTIQVGITVSTASWGAHAFFLVAYVMFWIGSVMMMTVAITVIIVVTKTSVTNVEQLAPAIIIPFVGTTTNALMGGVIASSSDYVDSRLAVPMIVVSYMICGVGIFVALIIYATYFVKLMNYGPPPPHMTPALVMLVGPCGQSSAALQELGNAARIHFGKYGAGTFLTSSAGEMVDTMGALLGLLFTGMALFFAAFAWYVVIEACLKPQMKYSLLWWSTIFPMATVNTAFISFSIEMDSPTFRILATGLLILLIIDYLLNWVFTLRDIFQGKLLNGKRSEHPASDRVKRQ